ncbi:procathepsin L-like isoform X3 [Protopterus annectens]|uniref:procathepsin L-like isoform X3 n=1 Tax=Protopterus annectens TaxID=7888 RepID=UPI001CFC0973|nr:procathepsin L-like isoform X3 [Protopterus annectens]
MLCECLSLFFSLHHILSCFIHWYLTMNLLCLLAVCIATADVFVGADPKLDGQWDSWKHVHSKTYPKGEEESRRKTWEENFLYINQHNEQESMGKQSFRLELNQFADMTSDEFSRQMNGYKHTGLAKEKLKHSSFSRLTNTTVLPDNVDWRGTKYVTPVKNQDGNPCQYNAQYNAGTCTGYSLIESGNENAVKAAVASIGPISAAMNAGLETFQFYRSGIYTDPKCSSRVLNHGIVIAGYGSTIQNGTYTNYWICKNSWGTTWGMQGYFLVARGKRNLCGITLKALYPLV